MKNRMIASLRLVGMLEGISFLLLLGVAMPLKYLAGMDSAVLAAGWAHGALFTVFFAVLLVTAHLAAWSLARTSLVLLAALLPFGPFVIDRSLAREQTGSTKIPIDD